MIGVNNKLRWMWISTNGMNAENTKTSSAFVNLMNLKKMDFSK